MQYIAGMLFNDNKQQKTMESQKNNTTNKKKNKKNQIDHGQTGISPVVVFIQ